MTARPIKRVGAVAHVLVAIVDTAALYTLGYLGVLASYLSKSNGQYAAIDAMAPLIVRPSICAHFSGLAQISSLV